ncbi:DUF4276 family protein [Rhizobium leguminosarum]|uniref:DUF4276 family protein n=1 Tax=Rhizobium leguminosarum TaxID=384 RepID=UPI0014426006|nr:DUF4276 family protein [Rhizobium leguminosarum]MBB4504592.1 hypothetical protein [Rhizobium leguminosarum]NKL59791.1 DUF4276 family protein [Rhizobium leguminosarum bv. viciae]
MLYVFPIVEGQGDERAIPVLIRNLLNNRFEHYEVEVLHPYRMPKGKMKQASEWPPVSTLVFNRLSERVVAPADKGLVLVMCDSDDDCPVELKATIQQNVAVSPDKIELHFVAPLREYETWLLSAVQSFAGHQDCVDPIPNVGDLDQIRDAKGYFERHILKPKRFYSETVDQAKFSSILDFSIFPEDNCRSLKRFVDIFARILQ